MFIERQQLPTIEYDPAAGQQEPVLAQYFSNAVELLKSPVSLLVHSEGERVLVVTSPLSQVVDGAIRLHRRPDFADLAVVDNKHRAFFEAVKAAVTQGAGRA